MSMCKFVPIGKDRHRCATCQTVVESHFPSHKIHRNCEFIEPVMLSRIGSRMETLIRWLRIKPSKPCQCQYIKGALDRAEVAEVYMNIDFYAGWIKQHTWAPRAAIKATLWTALAWEALASRLGRMKNSRITNRI